MRLLAALLGLICASTSLGPQALSLSAAGVRARFTPSGVEIDGWRFDFGRGAKAEPSLDGEAVVYRRPGGITERYERHARGIEQLFEVDRRPPGALELSAFVRGKGPVLVRDGAL